jgi:hypothetical protein
MLTGTVICQPSLFPCPPWEDKLPVELRRLACPASAGLLEWSHLLHDLSICLPEPLATSQR